MADETDNVTPAETPEAPVAPVENAVQELALETQEAPVVKKKAPAKKAAPKKEAAPKKPAASKAKKSEEAAAPAEASVGAPVAEAPAAEAAPEAPAPEAPAAPAAEAPVSAAPEAAPAATEAAPAAPKKEKAAKPAAAKAAAAAAPAPAFFDPVKPLEYPCLLLRGDAYAVVGNGKADIFILFINVYNHPAADVIIPDGVFRKVFYQLIHVLRLRFDSGIPERFEGYGFFVYYG